MSRQTETDECVVRLTQRRVIQFNGSADEDLALFGAKHRQFLQNFREAHGLI